MRLAEILEESSYGGFDLLFTSHFFDRVAERGIPKALVNNILSRIARVRKQILDIDTQTSINIYDRREGVHVVVSRPDNSMRLQLITAYKNPHYHGRNPVLPVR